MQSQAVADELTNGFVIYSAMWKPQQKRAFEIVGEWNQDTLRMRTDLFPNIKFGLNGKLLRTGTEVVSMKSSYNILCVMS